MCVGRDGSFEAAVVIGAAGRDFAIDVEFVAEVFAGLAFFIEETDSEFGGGAFLFERVALIGSAVKLLQGQVGDVDDIARLEVVGVLAQVFQIGIGGVIPERLPKEAKVHGDGG